MFDRSSIPTLTFMKGKTLPKTGEYRCRDERRAAYRIPNAILQLSVPSHYNIDV